MSWPGLDAARESGDDAMVPTVSRYSGDIASGAGVEEASPAAGAPWKREETIFHALLAQLHEEHERQLQKLHREIHQLSRRGAASVSPGSAAAKATPDGAPSHPSLQQSPSMVLDKYMRLRPSFSLQPVCVESQPSQPSAVGQVTTAKSTRDTDNHLLDILQPVQGSRCEALMKGPLDVTVGICIVLSIIAMFIQSEYQGYTVGVELGHQDPSSWRWPDGVEYYLDVSQYVFCSIFALEMAARLRVNGSAFFYAGNHWQFWNMLDLMVVCGMVVDTCFLAAGANEDATASISLLRMSRSLQLLRTMRALRAFKIFHKLRALVTVVFASLYALFWSMVLLAIVMLMGALVLCRSLSDRLDDDEISWSTREWLYMMYGTAGRSYYTVFELTFSGGWPTYARTLVEEVDTGFAYFFIIYISLVVFAVLRIITAVLIKDTLAAAADDTEMVIAEKTKEKNTYARKLKNFFAAADTTGDGLITFPEFNATLEDPRVRMYLSHLELDTQEYGQLFAMVDDGDGYVSVEEFVQGALRLKGTARSQDILAIAHNVKRLSKLVQSSVGRLHIELRAVHRDVESLKTQAI